MSVLLLGSELIFPELDLDLCSGIVSRFGGSELRGSDLEDIRKLPFFELAP